MDMDFNGDLVYLDAELLQLPEVSPLAIKANPYLAQELFEQWLSLPETNRLVGSFFLFPRWNMIDTLLLRICLVFLFICSFACNGQFWN